MDKAQEESPGVNSLKYALRVIYQGYRKARLRGDDHYICQMSNDNKGFSQDVIDALRERVGTFNFDIPVHISILPAGKRPSEQKLFDGMETVYCNSEDLERVIEGMKEQTVSGDRSH